ncbi:MAG: acylneuraminate cytidylyltransferase family protein [Alphaproteobacteria bacterium]|nr:acylneuraminate cytidylyltransferase family protein [Alphaproteobacteria bacterium]
MRRVALIPARGGSKRLPRKNILDFLGKPIIAWTIQAARETGLFERVVVSTEDPEIRKIALEYGAEIDDRSPALATDQASVREVCLEFLDRNSCDILCVLYATAPLRTTEDIVAVVNLIKPGWCDFSIAATRYDMPPHQALKAGQDGFIKPFWPDLVNRRASDIDPLVVDNGSTYAVSVPAFKNHKIFYGPGMRAHIMPRERSQDIDESLDLDLARFFAIRQAGSA